MEKVIGLIDDNYAVYIGTTPFCSSCQARKLDILRLGKILNMFSYYEMDANENIDFINQYKISKIPFFVISSKKKVIDISYTYESLLNSLSKILEGEGYSDREK